MPLQTEIVFPKADTDRFFAAIERAQKELGMKLWNSLAWGGTYIARSLKAATKESRKLRPIVRNPNERYKTDHRIAPWGVNRYYRGEKKFKPIFMTGEYGLVRFYDKKNSYWFDRSQGPGKWIRIPAEDALGNKAKYSIEKDKRRIIGRRGLAKKSWMWAASAMYRGGSGQVMDVPDVASINIDKSPTNPSITITNRLRHVSAAMKPGAVEDAKDKAANKMVKNIELKLAKLAAK